MLNFGIVGMNEGNGHPYSFAASFNGFDPEALEKYCDFPIIRKYLTTHHRNQEFIPEARISHIWTQDRAVSEGVAAVAKIPHISSSLEEMASQVDGIIFTRDDIWNHFEMASPLFKTGKPIYMDKLLCATEPELRAMLKIIGRDYPLLTASSFRYAPLVKEAANFMRDKSPLTVNGESHCLWIRYAPHLLDALFAISGRDVKTVQNTGTDRRDTVTLTYGSGMQAVMQVFDGMAGTLGLTYRFAAPQLPYEVPYTDKTLESYFFSIVEMMRAYTRMALGKERSVTLEETVFMNRVVLAGIASREQGGKKIEMKDFLADL
ncbi:MAG: hypothetical protein IJS01_13075 [Lentisphaeria bacterium]|nr:hypothetical protein [Lentisphaeria bacterium]